MTSTGMVTGALEAWHCTLDWLHDEALRQLARVPAGSWRREDGQDYDVIGWPNAQLIHDVLDVASSGRLNG